MTKRKTKADLEAEVAMLRRSLEQVQTSNDRMRENAYKRTERMVEREKQRKENRMRLIHSHMKLKRRFNAMFDKHFGV